MDMTADAEFWDGLAEKYSKQPIADVPAWERKQRITIEHLRPESEVLDVGCGTGSLALILAPHCARVHAVDVSPEMVRIADGKKAKQGADNVTFHCGTLDDPLGFEPGQFDGVCAFSILHLVPDLPGTLSRMYELLAPGGFFISSTVCLRNTWVPYGLILPVMRWLGKAPRVTQLSEASLVRAMRSAGFVDVTPTDVGAKDVVTFVVARKPG